MNTHEFITQTEKAVSRAMAVNVNSLMNLSKTNYLTCGLFLKLPIVITCEQSTKVQRSTTLQLADLNKVLAVYTVPGDITNIHFTFLYEDEKHLDKIYRTLEKHLHFFTYKYVKELQHIVRKHKTTTHAQMMAKQGTSEQLTYVQTILANDFVINSYMKALYDASPLAVKWKELLPFMNYNPEYANMTEIQVMQELVTGAAQINSSKFSENIHKFTYLNVDTYMVEEGPSADVSISNLGDNLYRTVKEATSGGANSAGGIFTELFEAVKIDVSWFKKLKSSIKKTVHHKTNDFHQSWSNLNNTYRHLYNSPTPIHTEKKLNLIISVDNSGSMNTEDLQKLLYLIKESGKQIAQCKVLVHTTDIAQEFNLNNEYDISLHPEFMTAFSVRHASGGTSHNEVFKYIQDMRIQNPEEYIYFSFSDNYSDIPDTVHSYPIMQKLTKYWISPSCGKMVDTDVVGGVNVVIP